MFTGRPTEECWEDVGMPSPPEDLAPMAGPLSHWAAPLLSAIGDAPSVYTADEAYWQWSDTCGGPLVRHTNTWQVFRGTISLRRSEAADLGLPIQEQARCWKMETLIQLLRSLENAVINGPAPLGGVDAGVTPMNGILCALRETRFRCGEGEIFRDRALSAETLRRLIAVASHEDWGARPDLIAVPPNLAGRVLSFEGAKRLHARWWFADAGRAYEIVVSPQVPPDSVLALSRAHIYVATRPGRHFQAWVLPEYGDLVRLEIVGEYTVQVREPWRHAALSGLEYGICGSAQVSPVSVESGSLAP